MDKEISRGHVINMYMRKKTRREKGWIPEKVEQTGETAEAAKKTRLASIP